MAESKFELKGICPVPLVHLSVHLLCLETLLRGLKSLNLPIWLLGDCPPARAGRWNGQPVTFCIHPHGCGTAPVRTGVCLPLTEALPGCSEDILFCSQTQNVAMPSFAGAWLLESSCCAGAAASSGACPGLGQLSGM